MDKISPIQSYIASRYYITNILGVKMYLIVDTETTGLPKDYRASIQNTENWPRLIQLAYQLYDEKENLVKEVNHIIRPDGFVIPLESTKVHGISTESAMAEGTNLVDALDELQSDIERADVIVGHNIDFDRRVIDCEYFRLRRYPLLSTKPQFCTMQSSTNLCKLEGRFGYKWPALAELHNFLFQEPFGPSQGQHNALQDVKIAARAYFKLRKML